MKLSDVRSLLVHADVLAFMPLARGFPLWLPFGTRLAEQFESLYLEELLQATEFVAVEPPLLVKESEYVSMMSGSYNYSNMFSLIQNELLFLIRPDNVVEASKIIAHEDLRLPLVMQGSIYRSETGNLKPLIRDRHIWCTTEVVHSPSADVADEAFAMHLAVFAKFLKRLCLASLFVESQPLREYAQRRILSYAAPQEGELTLTGTLYHLAQPLTERLGLPGPVFDLGFTAKLIAVLAALHADAAGLILSSSLAPDAVVVGCRTPADYPTARLLVEKLGRSIQRVTLDGGAWHRTLRINRRRGTPLLILVDTENGNRLIRRIDGRSTPLLNDELENVQEALTHHDEELLKRAQDTLAQAILAETAIRVSPTDNMSDAGWNLLGRLIGPGELPASPPCNTEFSYLFARTKRLY